MRERCGISGPWIHFIATTYGAWIYGDPRGFRTRHHREHVEGDYKSPPPVGKYANQFRKSTQSLKQPPVVLSPPWRPIVGVAIRHRLDELGAFVLCVAMGGQHLHALAKLPAGAEPRQWVGLAKKHSYFEATSRGWRGKLWAKRGKEIGVRDRAHQLNVYRYILAHAQQGAWVWDWRQERPHGPQSVGLDPE